jgi:ATP phosphoribosyltransferase regulatory subunit
MAKINRWLLPDGVEEILPKQAWQIEAFQRQTLDLYRSWGYELVIPPLIEYSESLLIGMGSDMDLQTFKLTDQLSGRTLAIRADITPQTARIDSHSWPQQGLARFCYVGTVVRTKPKTQLSSRLPIELGAELYGDASLASDKEVISLMLASLAQASIGKVHLDLGHIQIYRGLVEAAALPADTAEQLSDAMERKAACEIQQLLEQHNVTAELAAMILSLVELNGCISTIANAKQALAKAPSKVLAALAELEQLALWIGEQFPATPLFIDLAELRSYQYHTGLVFAAYIDGVGHAVANGGRFDGIGKAFGRARPATGFSINVNALLPQMPEQSNCELILAPASDDVALQAKITELRQQGRRVIQAFNGTEQTNCQYQLVLEQGQWQVKHCI